MAHLSITQVITIQRRYLHKEERGGFCLLPYLPSNQTNPLQTVHQTWVGSLLAEQETSNHLNLYFFFWPIDAGYRFKPNLIPTS